MRKRGVSSTTMSLIERVKEHLAREKTPDPYPEINHKMSKHLAKEAHQLALALDTHRVFKLNEEEQNRFDITLATYISHIMLEPNLTRFVAPKLSNIDLNVIVLDAFQKDFAIPYAPPASLNITARTHDRALYNLSRTTVITALDRLNQHGENLPTMWLKDMAIRVRDSKPPLQADPYTVNNTTLNSQIIVTDGIQQDIDQLHGTRSNPVS